MQLQNKELFIEKMMKECNIGRETATAYLDSVDWMFWLAVRDFQMDKKAVERGILQWKIPITE